MSADLAAAHYAETGLRALQDGDIPRAVGAFAAIDDDTWERYRQRFVGFPDPAAIAAAVAELAGTSTATALEAGR